MPPGPNEYSVRIPISRYSNSTPLKGEVQVFSSSPFKELAGALDGLFTFCLYNTSAETKAGLDEFTRAPIVVGLQLYADMLHDTTVKDKLSKWGALIYTNTASYKYIRKLFPLDVYPKLFIAVVMWPYYSGNDGVLEESIMRCMRHHAKEVFPDKNICIRDSDSLFELAYYIDHKEHEKDMIALVRAWELSFLYSWLPCLTPEERAAVDPNKPSIASPIVLGRGYNYFCNWHVDLPFPTPFKDDVYKTIDMFTFYETTPSIYFKGKGLYAGFINISCDYNGMLWKHVTEYLLHRYYMADVAGHMYISDVYDTVGSKERHDSSNSIGKDERLLIFVYAQVALDDIYILYINYNCLDPKIIAIDFENQGYKKELLAESLIVPGYIDAALRLTFKDIERSANLWHAQAQRAIGTGDKESIYLSMTYNPNFGGVSKDDMNRSAAEYFKEEFIKIRRDYAKFLKKLTPHIFYKTIDRFIRSTGYTGSYFYPQAAVSNEVDYNIHPTINIKYRWPAHTRKGNAWKALLGLHRNRNRTLRRRRF